MSNATAKGPVTVSNTAELRAALVAGYKAEEITLPSPEDHSAAIAKARSEGHAAGVAETDAKAEPKIAAARIEGATAERERIKQVEGAVLPGHEALIATLKYDGKTTGPEAAAQVITAERAKLGKRAEDIAADAAAAATTVAQPSMDQAAAAKKPKADPNLPIEDRCKAEWQGDPGLRAEFDSVETYIAYAKANEAGRVRVLRDRVAKP